ncbi:MAG: VCBS domain-containing protein, partial [Planctomycetales bacterium]|nr:VCBS domain-containing protein [Planctomycetales bacterium]
VLLGEGWSGDVSTLKSLFDDMLDLQFTFSAGLEPADGANDLLRGDSGNDFLLGGAGDDTLDGGSGTAVIIGDSLSVDAAITFDAENLEFATDIDFVRSGNGADTITAGNDHTLVIGGGGDDTIIGNTSGTSLLFGNGGNDIITGRNSFAVIAGGEGDDTIDGTGFLIGDSFSFSTFGSSVFDALANGSLSAGVALTAEDSGADTIQGGNGFDFIVGGDGDDEIDGGDGLNIVFGDAFNLKLSVGLTFEKIFSFESAFSIFSAPLAILKLFEFEFELSGTGSDTYEGGSDTDVVFGGRGDDTLRGNAGFDFLVGGDGDDNVEAGNDSLISGEFFGVAFGGPGDDTITGSSGADYLESEEGNDQFFGLEGDDIIFGGPDADTLDGGPGNDRLYGEGGDDEIIGGEGNDEIYGGAGSDSLDGGPGSNTVNQDPVPPRVIAIGPAPGAENPTSATSVVFTVLFDASVNGVDPADFVIVPTGSATGTIANVSATPGQIFSVTVNSVRGVGNLRLDFDNDASGGVHDNLANVSTEDFIGGYYVINSPIDGNHPPTVTRPISITASENDAQFIVDLLDGSGDPDLGDVIFVSNLLHTAGSAAGISTGTNSLTIDPSAYKYLPKDQHELINYSFDIQDGHGGSVSQTATINISGANDPASISGTLTASLDEDSLLPVSGLLIVTDPDQGEDAVVPQVASEGIFGTFWITPSGDWTYQLNNSTVQFLHSGDSVIDHFTVQSLDGTAISEVIITILGNDDLLPGDQRILFITGDAQPVGYEPGVIS